MRFATMKGTGVTLGKTMGTTELLQTIKQRIAAVEPDAEVILYGSFARGDHGPDSDVDLLILVDRDKFDVELEKRIVFPLYDLEIDTGRTISPKVLTRKEWESRPFVTPFFLNVQRDGRVL